MKDRKPNGLQRREFIRQVLGAAGCIPAAQLAFSQAGTEKAAAAQSAPANPLSVEDDLFLDELEKTTFQYFWDQANPKTGLVKDRCNVQGNDNGLVGSIASTGFG